MGRQHNISKNQKTDLHGEKEKNSNIKGTDDNEKIFQNVKSFVKQVHDFREFRIKLK